MPQNSPPRGLTCSGTAHDKFAAKHLLADGCIQARDALYQLLQRRVAHLIGRLFQRDDANARQFGPFQLIEAQQADIAAPLDAQPARATCSVSAPLAEITALRRPRWRPLKPLSTCSSCCGSLSGVSACSASRPEYCAMVCLKACSRSSRVSTVPIGSLRNKIA